jgi:signal transduction histidine kinase
VVTLNALTLLINSLTLALALGFLVIILWHDARKELHQFFAIFLLFVGFWNVGSLLVQAALLPDVDFILPELALTILELGFSGSSVAIYVLVTMLVGVQISQFRALAFASLSLIIGYRVFLFIAQTPLLSDSQTSVLDFRFDPLFLAFYLIFDGFTLYLLWRYRRKMRSRGLISGIVIFLIGQSFTFANPELVIASISTSVSSVGALILSFAILQQEIMTPLAERSSQVEAMHRVSLAITSQISVGTVLNEIARQAASWLMADGVGIFLLRHQGLELATVHNLPAQLRGTLLRLDQGVAGAVVVTQQSIYLENYGRDWRSEPDFPIARDTFGSVICVPLSYAGTIIGALMVVAGVQGRMFDQHDVYLLELLGAQASVAIAHNNFFEEQKALTQQLKAAHSQLETVLTSTENPVIAVGRDLRIIFANPAAQQALRLPSAENQPIYEMVSREFFPQDIRDALRRMRRKEGFTYEVSLANRVYLCHVAILGNPRIAGFVAVLNDVTELKELDRLKSEMVRMASHDLKNPLMGALAYVDLLRDDLKGENREAQEAVSVLEQQLERMNRIISGILDLERLRTNSARASICFPSELVERSVSELDLLLQAKSVQVSIDIQRDIGNFLGDPEQFQRVLVNLIENAIKFTLKDAQIRIGVRDDGVMIIFSVSDNGIGIPKDLQGKVFDRFFRGGQKGAEHVSGSGLGLALVKTIVENHHGAVWLTSEEGEGTTFFVSVPAARQLMPSHSQ